MRVRPLLVLAALSGATVIVAAPSPAGAEAVSVSGTTITVTSTSDETIRFGCTSGTVRVNGSATSPTLSCSALSAVTVTSINTSNQTVDGDDLNDPAFTANPALTANLGAGDDQVTESDRADAINLGAGDDELVLRLPTVTNTTLDLGADTDRVVASATAADDTISVSSTGASAQISITAPGGAASYTVSNADAARIDGLVGNDTVSSANVTAASTIDSVVLVGSDGDDLLRSGAIPAQLQGGVGTNEFDGGSGPDTALTASETDVIDLGGGANKVLDTSSLRSGGRTTTGSGGGSDTWYLGAYPGDATVRIRSNGSAGTSKVVTSLTRPGIQQLGTSYDRIEVALNKAGEPKSAAIADVVALEGVQIAVASANNPNELFEATIPAGSWEAAAVGFSWTIDPVDPAYATIEATGYTSVYVHNPWPNATQSFVHRAVRDLQFRFAAATERIEVADALVAGSTTRPAFVAALMDTDRYRGLDVDRVFVKYLRREADPGGRSYWINSLDDGKALWRFRAQLFGSNEYFAKAGGTNAQYVTLAYSDVLGRAPDPSGQTYWTNKLNNGADRGAVALQFINSAEARRRLVDDQFLRFLDRKPTPSEQTTWVAALPSDTGELDLIRFLAASNAFYARS